MFPIAPGAPQSGSEVWYYCCCQRQDGAFTAQAWIPAVWSSRRFLPSLGLSFLICKMVMRGLNMLIHEKPWKGDLTELSAQEGPPHATLLGCSFQNLFLGFSLTDATPVVCWGRRGPERSRLPSQSLLPSWVSRNGSP